jgi:hypothetical protein
MEIRSIAPNPNPGNAVDLHSERGTVTARLCKNNFTI